MCERVRWHCYAILREKIARKSLLPHPNGKVLPPAIKAANLRVGAIMEKADSSATTRKRGPYAKYTAEQKALIGKRATECGVAATVSFY